MLALLPQNTSKLNFVDNNATVPAAILNAAQFSTYIDKRR